MRGIAELKLVGRLMAYAIRHQPNVVPIALVGILSSAAELGAVICLIPLGIVASGNPLSDHSLWMKVPHALGMTPDPKFFIVLFLATWLFRMVSNMLALVLNGYVMQSLFAHFSIHAHASFVRHLPFSEIIKHQIGHFFTLAGDEANRGAQIVVGTIRIIPVIALFTAYAAFIFYQSWQAGIALAALAFALGLVLKGVFRKALRLGQRQQEESRAANTLFFDSLGGLRTVRGFTAEDFVISRYTRLTHNYVRTCFWGEALSHTTHLPFMILIAGALGTIAFYADNIWLLANMPLFFAVLMMLTRLMPMANYGLDIAMKLTSNLKAGRNVADMLDAVSQSIEGNEHADFPIEEEIRQIVFDNVTFQYSNDTPPILQNFTCSLNAGHSYAITGPSGVGKSSLIDLLLKFYRPDSGTILVNGRDIAKLSAISLRRRMILAEQATRIFYGSVLENVQFDSDNSRQAGEQALHLVGLDELLASLPQGADTILAFQGNNFSGGQRQRIGLARAIVRDADMLILDESINALDFETRKRILDNLLASYSDRIIVFVTHDPYVMERVDEIIELRSAEQIPQETAAE